MSKVVEKNERVEAPRYSKEELAKRPWLAFEGVLTKEDGEDLEQAIEEMFPTEK